MVVTPEVSQLETSALIFFKSMKSSLMSVTAETSQSATGPYVAMADAGSALNAWTAAFREAVLVKVPGGDGGGDGGDGGGGGGDSLGVSVVCGGCVGGGGDLRAGRAGGAGVSDYDRSCDEERGGCGGSGCGGLGDGVHYSGGDSGRDGGTVQRSS